MGAGKTTFVRHLLSQLNVVQPPEGSPSFALAHEYHSSRGDIIHIDFYRLKSEMEIEEAGLLAYYWERKAIVISEWLGSWPDLELQVLRSGRAWKISLAFCADTDGENLRDIRIELLN